MVANLNLESECFPPINCWLLFLKYAGSKHDWHFTWAPAYHKIHEENSQVSHWRTLVFTTKQSFKVKLNKAGSRQTKPVIRHLARKQWKKCSSRKTCFVTKRPKCRRILVQFLEHFNPIQTKEAQNPRMERQLFCRSSQKNRIKKCIVGSFPELSNFSVCGKNDHCGKKIQAKLSMRWFGNVEIKQFFSKNAFFTLEQNLSNQLHWKLLS